LTAERQWSGELKLNLRTRKKNTAQRSILFLKTGGTPPNPDVTEDVHHSDQESKRGGSRDERLPAWSSGAGGEEGVRAGRGELVLEFLRGVSGR
jgi:hypothetical protein